MFKVIWLLMRWPYLELRVALARPRIAKTKAALNRAIVTQIGYATQGWSALEVVLDLTNWSFVQHMPKREPFPLALGKNLDLFRRGHKTIPALAPHLAEGLALAADIEALSAKRHDMIHGYALGEMSDSVVQLYHHVVPRGDANRHMLIAERRSYPRREFVNFANETLALSKRVIAHAFVVIAATDSQHHIEQLTREARIAEA